MNCKKCGHQLANDSKFCTNCGEKVSNSEKFENPTMDEIKAHLEFLGYACEFVEGNPKQVTLICKHTNKPNLILNSGNKNFVFLNSGWNGLKEINSIEQFKHLNKLNGGTTVSTMVLNDDGDLNFYCSYTGDYHKNRFGEFLDVFLNDINKSMKDENFQKLFMK